MSPALRRSIAETFLPGLLLGIAYVAFATRSGRELAAARAAVEGTKAAAPSPAVEARSADALRGLRDEVEALRRASARLGGKLDAAAGVARTEAGERLAHLLARHGLGLSEETRGAGPVLPVVPAALERAAAAEPGGFALRLRTLRFVGSYVDTLDALRGIASPEVGAIPLRVRMARSPGGALSWTVVLWM